MYAQAQGRTAPKGECGHIRQIPTEHVTYGTTQIQLHTRTCTGLSHACANMCPVTSDGTLVSLTYCTRVLHEGLHTRVWCSSGYIHI